METALGPISARQDGGFLPQAGATTGDCVNRERSGLDGREHRKRSRHRFAARHGANVTPSYTRIGIRDVERLTCRPDGINVGAPASADAV